MEQKRTTFSAKGVLNGMGREALCTASGTRKTQSDGKAGELLRLSVFQEPEDLPDGLYELKCQGQIEKVWRKAGFWVAERL